MGKNIRRKAGADNRNVNNLFAGLRTKLTFGLVAAHVILNAYTSSGDN